jgi:para-aminobenzoate synthetase/4-amino-4-deoxychorismate lyase
MANQVVLQDRQGSRWLQFTEPREVVIATHLDEVLPSLARIEKLVNEQGLYAAGFIAYEAAPAFDRALQVQLPAGLPLVWFGLYDIPRQINAPMGSMAYSIDEWSPTVEWNEYRPAIAKIKEHISAGDTYQVNYTFRLRATFEGDPWGLFLDLIRAQESSFAAYLDIGSTAICSASPELFFELNGNEMLARPMKGTARRGRTYSEDKRLAEWLYHSEKNRAENVMIVDMIRNDMGRVCTTGSVRVPKLFEVERYPTLWQMTSTVEGQTTASIVTIMEALFPCASITGAPKVRTMQIIADSEPVPRGVYTGCIGYIAPNRRAQFNVAIRTVSIDKVQNLAEYGVGGGIVADSGIADEYEECQTKARILFDSRPAFRLLESILWTPEEGYFLLDEHIRRLADSAAYFGFKLDLAALQARLTAFRTSLPVGPQKVRLLLNRDGVVELEAVEIGSEGSVTVGLTAEPINSDDIFLYHKTTRRAIYDEARASRPDCDDVLLWNERGEITESSSANVVLKLDGELLTPPMDCGLLPGTFRGRLLANGLVRERVLTKEDLWMSEAVYLINSVRQWREARPVRQD